MFKKSLIAIAVLAIAMPAVAGQLKIHGDWPCTCSYQEETVAVLDVKMTVGYYVHIVNQDDIILTQYGEEDPYHTYRGCTSSAVDANFDVLLKGSVAAVASVIGGSYEIDVFTVNGAGDADGATALVSTQPNTLDICVLGKDIQIQNGLANTEYKVAEVTITAMPVGAPGCCSTPGTPIQGGN
jgi:hypothetical protein